MINDESSIRVHGDALYRAECGKISRFEVSMGHSAKRAADLDVFITGKSVAGSCNLELLVKLFQH